MKKRQNCPFSLPFPTVITFHGVKKSPLIIGIVGRIKINSDQPLPFSKSELLISYFLQILRITYVWFVYFAVIAKVCINFHRQHVWSFIQWWCERGAKSHVSKEISGRGRRRSRGVKGNQGAGDFRFINILQFFSIYYYYYFLIIFSILFLPTTFTHTHTHTHEPRPLPTTHDPRHLATLSNMHLLPCVTSTDKHNKWIEITACPFFASNN